MEAAARGEFEGSWVPGTGSAADEKEKLREKEKEAGQQEDDDLADELDIMKITAVGKRKSSRQRTQRTISGYMLDTSQIALSEDSDSSN